MATIHALPQHHKDVTATIKFILYRYDKKGAGSGSIFGTRKCCGIAVMWCCGVVIKESCMSAALAPTGRDARFHLGSVAAGIAFLA